MKKLIISIFLLATLSCGGKGGVLNPVSANSCEKTAEQYEKVLNVWIQDPSNKANCEDLKKALNDIVKNCSAYTAAQRKTYEDQIKLLTCD